MKAIKLLKQAWVGLMAYVFASAAMAAAAAPVLESGATQFDAITKWMNEFVKFLQGPFGKMVVIGGTVVAMCLWIFAPKDGIMGLVLRVVGGGIMIINVSALVVSITG